MSPDLQAAIERITNDEPLGWVAMLLALELVIMEWLGPDAHPFAIHAAMSIAMDTSDDVGEA